MPIEEFFKLAVNYGLGVFFAVGIAVVFYFNLKEDKKISIAREERLMRFMEEHSFATQKQIQSHDSDFKNFIQEFKQVNSFVRDDLKSIQSKIT